VKTHNKVQGVFIWWYLFVRPYFANNVLTAVAGLQQQRVAKNDGSTMLQ
jgi:hypothetical protein